MHVSTCTTAALYIHNSFHFNCTDELNNALANARRAVANDGPRTRGSFVHVPAARPGAFLLQVRDMYKYDTYM